jgi:hypothetical protein
MILNNFSFAGTSIEHPPVFQVSGKLGKNIQPLLLFIRKIYDGNEANNTIYSKKVDEIVDNLPQL